MHYIALSIVKISIQVMMISSLHLTQGTLLVLSLLWMQALQMQHPILKHEPFVVSSK